MSSFYGMTLTVEKFDTTKTKKIKGAAKEQWPFDDNNWSMERGQLYGYGEGTLGGGEGDDAFAERLAKAVFKANGGPCQIEIAAAYLESPPTNDFCFGAKEYAKLMKPKKPDKKGGSGDGSRT